MPNEFSVIVLGYQRLYSIQRLLKSLLEAAIVFKKQDPIDLVISLEHQSDVEVKNFCANFFSRHFNITIINHNTSLGPDKHNLWAMQQAEKYGAVLVLEDDTMVSPSLFYYAKAALHYYSSDTNIAGISLYDYEQNEANNYPFLKLLDGGDSYFYQRASSRGLLITASQWKAFSAFNPPKLKTNMPDAYEKWGDEVWEKKFLQYLISERKFWVFPMRSLTTNFGELGAHVKKKIYRHAFQSTYLQAVQFTYHFKSLAESNAVYDVYGESLRLYGFSENEISCDILGLKNLNHISTKYILTSRNCLQHIEEYALDIKPPEANLTHHLIGSDLKVTEVKYISESKIQKQFRLLKLHYYFYPDKGILHLLQLKFMEILARISIIKAK